MIYKIIKYLTCPIELNLRKTIYILDNSHKRRYKKCISWGNSAHIQGENIAFFQSKGKAEYREASMSNNRSSLIVPKRTSVICIVPKGILCDLPCCNGYV